MMEAVQSEIVRNPTSNYSTNSYVNGTDINELPKDKEEELLYGMGDDGDEEETLSDDSLRLRLSDDEDAEQEDPTICINMLELKLQKESTIAATADKKLYSDSKQTVEETTSSNNKLKQKEHNEAVNVPENSTLSLDEYTSENKSTQNNLYNLENNSAAVIANGDICEVENIADNPNCSNLQKNFIATNDKEDNFTLDINNSKILNNVKEIQTTNDKIKSDKEIFQVLKIKSLSTHFDQDENMEVEVLNNKLKTENREIKCTSKSGENLKIIETSNMCLSDTSEKYILENVDNLSTDNYIKSSNCLNRELTINNKGYLKRITSDPNEKNAINNSKLNTLENIENNNPHINSVKVCSKEKSSITSSFHNNQDNLTILNDKLMDKTSINDTQCKKRPRDINHVQNSINAIKFNSLEDSSSSCKNFVQDKDTKRNIQHEDKIQRENPPKTQTIQRKASTIIVQNENDVTDIKGKIEINKEHDVNKNIDQVTDNNPSATICILLPPINMENVDENKNKNALMVNQRRMRSKRTINTIQDHAIEEDRKEGKESGRQKRRTAKNAEEIIRKEYLNNSSNSSDSTDFERINERSNQSSSSLLKRDCPDNEHIRLNGTVKKAKLSLKPDEKNDTNDISNLAYVEKFFQRNIKEELPKLTQEELEELLIQKIVETITMRSEIGQLREQARISEKNQEITRAKLQILTKQIKDFEMVLSRNTTDRRANPDKFIAPIKINRSVGLQVNFLTDHGMQNLRQIQQNLKPGNVQESTSSPVPEATNNIVNQRRGIKIRSPRRSEIATVVPTPTISQSPIQGASLISAVTPAALVVAKPIESQHTLSLSSQPNNVQQLLSAQPQMQVQHITLNGKLQNQINRQPLPIAPKPRNNDLIDLTDEEEKNKSSMKVTAVTANSLLEHQLGMTPKPPTQCFQRVIQTLPANVAITTQATSLRMIQPSQPTPAAIVNNLNPPRLAYVMQSGVGSTRQLLITSNANQMRPVTTCNRSQFPTLTYKTGISTIANGTVRVLTTPALSNVQINKHPAPLPDTPTYTMTPGWKLPPPAPSLKISKVANGIVLSWNMMLSDKYADIASYQLYAYQEITGISPNTALWKKVGDVRALPLPMACTLTQFSEGNNYYFAVRAVDTHSRKGQYSIPGNISL